MSEEDFIPHPSEVVIHDVLQKAYSREQAHGREPIYFRTSLEEMIAREEGEPADEYLIRREAFERTMEYFFADGPHPGHVIRRVFALAKASKPQLLLNMSLAEIGLMLGETKAAGSWRIKKLVNGAFEAAGHKGVVLPWQKSATAIENYAEAAKGNTNRRLGKRRKKRPIPKSQPKKTTPNTANP